MMMMHNNNNNNNNKKNNTTATKNDDNNNNSNNNTNIISRTAAILPRALVCFRFSYASYILVLIRIITLEKLIKIFSLIFDSLFEGI